MIAIHGDITQVPVDYAAYFDVMIVDPPYSQYVHSHAASMGVKGRGPRKRDLGFAACTRQLRIWLGRATVYVKGWSLIFSDIESAHLWRLATTAPYIRSVVSDGGYEGAVPWVRWSQPQLSGGQAPNGG